MMTATMSPDRPVALGADSPKHTTKRWRPSGLLLFVIFVALFMATEIAFFTVAHMLPNDYIGDQPRVQAPVDDGTTER